MLVVLAYVVADWERAVSPHGVVAAEALGLAREDVEVRPREIGMAVSSVVSAVAARDGRVGSTWTVCVRVEVPEDKVNTCASPIV